MVKFQTFHPLFRGGQGGERSLSLRGHCEPSCRKTLMVENKLSSAKRRGNLKFIIMDKTLKADCRAPFLGFKCLLPFA